MKQKFILSIVLTVILLLFSLQNMAPVTIQILIFKFSMPLSILILTVAILGVLIGLGFAVLKEMSYKKAVKYKSKEIASLKKEISKLNKSAFGQDIQSSEESQINAQYIDSIFANKKIQDEENEKLKEKFEQLFTKENNDTELNKRKSKTSSEKNPSVKTKETENSDDDDEKHTKKITPKLSPQDYRMVGFDDIDLKSFSFEEIIDTKEKKEDDQWFMGDSKKIDLDHKEEKKHNIEKIDAIKEGYSKILSDFDSVKNKKPDMNSSSNEIKLDEQNTIRVSQDAILRECEKNEKKSKDDDDNNKPPKNSGPKKDAKKKSKDKKEEQDGKKDITKDIKDKKDNIKEISKNEIKKSSEDKTEEKVLNDNIKKSEIAENESKSETNEFNDISKDEKVLNDNIKKSEITETESKSQINEFNDIPKDDIDKSNEKVLNDDVKKAEIKENDDITSVSSENSKMQKEILKALKQQAQKPLNYNISQDYITTKSFLALHKQDTNKENTLSQDKVMQNFNWSYDKSEIENTKDDNIKSFKDKFHSLFTGNKNLSDSLNN